MEQALAELNQWEGKERRATDFGTLPPFESRSGSNPHALISIPTSSLAVGVLRGADKVVVLDVDGKELARLKGPGSPVALASTGSFIAVVGEGDNKLWLYDQSKPPLTLVKAVELEGALSLRAIATTSPSSVAVADSVSGAIIDFNFAEDKRVELARCHDPIALETTANYLLANCASDHQIRIWRRAGSQWKALEPIEHDGQMWSLDPHETDDGRLVVAIGGIEDRPLDRSDQGSFGYIDSFVYLYQLVDKGEAATRLAAVNVGLHGLITPKWIDLDFSADKTSIVTAGYGSPTELELEWKTGSWAKPTTTSKRPLVPGTTGRLVRGDTAIYPNTIFDGWTVATAKARPTLVAAAPANQLSVESRIGEMLFFTQLMAPWSTSTDRKSSFTCEACHFEGYVDGRIHFTGRGDVNATSRPLRGLFNNAPHFSRALDETSTEMVDNEFSVANKLNGRSPWFSLSAADFEWLSHGGFEAPKTMSPTYLRRALMVFLRDFTHRPNPAVRDRSQLSAVEEKGAELFRDQCESCHRAQLVASDERTRVAFDRWPKHIFSKTGGLVWGRTGYEKTGVLPYVHEKGARTPTLRRLYKKWPYFTNGSAKTLAAVLDAVRTNLPGGRFSHASEDGGKTLADDEKKALLAFLRLL